MNAQAAEDREESADAADNEGSSKKSEDNPRMHLTQQERQWALDIKECVERLPDLDDLPDYMYAQYALIEKEDTEAALKRAYQMQDFRQEYRMMDTYEDGCRAMSDQSQLFPKLSLSFSFFNRDNNYVFVFDYKGFEKSMLQGNPKRVATLFVSNCYLMHCFTPDFTSIREGAVMIAECDGYDWTKHVDLHLYRKYWSELGIAYPIRLKKLKHFNNGVFFNLLYSMTKHIMSADLRDAFEVGCQVEGGDTLDQIYLTPDVETARIRVYNSLTSTLKLRYENQKNFTLTTE